MRCEFYVVGSIFHQCENQCCSGELGDGLEQKSESKPMIRKAFCMREHHDFYEENFSVGSQASEVELPSVVTQALSEGLTPKEDEQYALPDPIHGYNCMVC